MSQCGRIPFPLRQQDQPSKSVQAGYDKQLQVRSITLKDLKSCSFSQHFRDVLRISGGSEFPQRPLVCKDQLWTADRGPDAAASFQFQVIFVASLINVPLSAGWLCCRVIYDNGFMKLFVPPWCVLSHGVSDLFSGLSDRGHVTRGRAHLGSF